MRSGRATGAITLSWMRAQLLKEGAAPSSCVWWESGCKNKGGPRAWVSRRVGGLCMATVAWRGVTDRAPCIEQLDLINLLFSAIQATCTLFRGKAHPHPDLPSDWYMPCKGTLHYCASSDSKKCIYTTTDQKIQWFLIDGKLRHWFINLICKVVKSCA